MIENIRKFKGLIIFGLAIVIIGLVIGIKDDLFRGGASGRGYLKIAGLTYDEGDFQRLGEGSYKLAYNIAYSGNYELMQFIMSLSPRSAGGDDEVEKFFIGRMILRQAKQEFGIHPSEDEISDHIRKMRAFADKDGKFSEENYRNFVEKRIGHLGMTEADLRELVSDVIAAEKITAIVGSGLGVNRDIAARNLALDNQQAAGELARLDIDPYEAKIEPTDEDIKKFWETIQDAFTTEPLRKFTYFIATPEMPADAEAEKTDDKETIADAALSDEEKKKKEAEKAKKAAELAEARRKKQTELDALVDDFTFQLEEQKGSGFEELVKANKWEVKTTELFPRTKPPKELDVNLRSSSRGGKAVDELFKIEITSDPLSKYSQPIAIGENQWIVARLDGEEKSRPKTFEEAKAEARDKYISEKAAEALKTAANEALTKIKESIAAGKSFADAAKEAGIAETKTFTKAGSSYRPDPATEPRNLFESIRNTDPGALAEVIIEADRAFIAHVASREVVKEENADERLTTEVKRIADENKITAFTGWITARTEAAKVEQLYRKK